MLKWIKRLLANGSVIKWTFVDQQHSRQMFWVTNAFCEEVLTHFPAQTIRFDFRYNKSHSKAAGSNIHLKASGGDTF